MDYCLYEFKYFLNKVLVNQKSVIFQDTFPIKL